MWKQMLPASLWLWTELFRSCLHLQEVVLSCCHMGLLPSLGSSWITGDLWVRLHAKQGLENLAMSRWNWWWATAAHTHKSERKVMLPRSGKGIASVVLYLFESPAYYFNWVFQGKLYDSMLNSKQVSGWKWFWWVKSEPVIANAFVLVCFTRLFKCVLWWYCLFQDVKEKC